MEEKEGFNIDENENADDNGVDDDESDVTQIEIENHNSPSEIKSRLLAVWEIRFFSLCERVR